MSESYLHFSAKMLRQLTVLIVSGCPSFAPQLLPALPEQPTTTAAATISAVAGVARR